MIDKTSYTFEDEQDAQTGSNLITAEDIFAASEELYPLEVPELSKNGRPGLVYIKPVQASMALWFSDLPASKKSRGLLSLIAHGVVKSDGSPMFNAEQVKQIKHMRADIFSRLGEAVVEHINPKERNEIANDTAEPDIDNPLASTSGESEMVDYDPLTD